MQNSENRARGVIAMLTPSSNTVVEPFTSAMAWPLFPDVSVHFGRFQVTKIALDAHSNQQFALEPILQAADLLADARPDVIAWNGTSASWLGFETDRRLCAAITERTGIPATSAILGLNELLQETGVRRLGLVTPYTEDVQRKIIANYQAIGIETVAERHSGRSDNHSFAEVSEAEIETMCLEVGAAKPDAIAIVCTNMRGPLIAPALEQRLGIPVLDSVAFTLWACLRKLGIPMEPLAQYGRMFSIPGGDAAPRVRD
ncbi:maleate cis-trans isomerase family protein [Terrihabitans rhizophilus]|uniref:Aspartate/glutamate racemase family protein n=1 Tax=Terrihabitans rhizophilus TaxID=3092662 RepID=A0ABU4RMA4_9HYPH|nr:aspartate/glutamate racemase family protein [Terrihabitans sp. PJ23]MDX6805954.1 aspartate/glutamate racemase family protein [Terrihabitans sp. PJ23]